MIHVAARCQINRRAAVAITRKKSNPLSQHCMNIAISSNFITSVPHEKKLLIIIK